MSVRETRRKADAGIDRSWLEYPEGIPVEAWGRDHNSTLLYAETRAVDHHGALSATDPHMRVSRAFSRRFVAGRRDTTSSRSSAPPRTSWPSCEPSSGRVGGSA